MGEFYARGGTTLDLLYDCLEVCLSMLRNKQQDRVAVVELSFEELVEFVSPILMKDDSVPASK